MRKIACFVLLLTFTLGLRAADTPPTSVELSYWANLQQELTELRSANTAVGIRGLYIPITSELLAPVARRIEDFLDRRDEDPVDELGEDFSAYRGQVIKLLENALGPVTAAQKFHSTMVTDGMERMATVLRLRREVSAMDDLKPRLASLHQKINQRVAAAGHPPRPFFQTIGIGDEPRTAGDLVDADERHRRFIAESRELHESLGQLTEHIVVALVKEQGISPEQAMQAMDDAFKRMNDAVGNASIEDIRGALVDRAALNDDGSISQPYHLLTLNLLEAENRIAHQLIMQEWRGAYHRWTGGRDSISPLGIAGDVTVGPDGRWFAHAADERSLVVRDPAGVILTSHRFDEPLRAFSANVDGDIDVITTKRTYRIMLGGEKAQIMAFSEKPNRFVQPHIRSAAGYNRGIYAFGVMPGSYTGDTENTFASATPGSRISAVAISGDGRRLAYGYAGDRYLPGGIQQFGFYQLTFDQGPIDSSKEIEVRHGDMLIRGAVTSLSANETGDRVASTIDGRFGGLVTYHEFKDDKVERKTLAADGQAYHWVHLIDGDAPRVIAGTRQGVVRVWDVNSGALRLRFEVPASVEGVGLAVMGDALISVALGEESIHRWSLADGTLQSSLAGAAPAVDAVQLAARLAEEQTLRSKVHAKFVRLWELSHEDEERQKLFTELRGPLAEASGALGVRATLDYGYALDRYRAVKALVDQKRYAEAYAMGRKDIDAGLLDDSHFELTLWAGSSTLTSNSSKHTAASYAPMITLAERGGALFAGNAGINTTLHELRAYQFLAQRKIREALAEVDQMDLWSPKNAPSASLRLFILHTGANHFSQSNRRLAAEYYLEAINFETDKSRQLHLAESAFAIAVQAQDWPQALNAANIILSLNPSKQNDQNFMHWARTAYQNVNR